MIWREVSFSDFLLERKERFEPTDPRITDLKKISKIDFSAGEIHLTDYTPTKTKQIIVYPGDFVFSGLNIEKGAVSINSLDEPLVVSANYSTCEVDYTVICREFLEILIHSPVFKALLKDNLKKDYGFTRPKHLYSLFLEVPKDIEDQEKLVVETKRALKTIKVLQNSSEKQLSLVQDLRQAFLREAMQGKLVPQDPNDEPASVLLERIKAEKERLVKEKKIRKQKPLPPISEDEIPFEIPDSWVWCRLGESGDLKRGKSKHRPRNDEKLFKDGKYPFIQTGDVARSKSNGHIISSVNGHYNEFGLAQSEMQVKGTLCITIAANIAECGFLGFDACAPDSIVCFTSLDKATERFAFYYIIDARDEIETYAPATAQKNINLGILSSLLVPFPPLCEQQRIISKLDDLMAYCDELEKNIKERQEQNNLLLQQVLREALEVQ